MLRPLIAWILALAGLSAHAATVAFLELRDNSGQPVQLKRGGRFAHVAIRFDDLWLHAHPERGVDLVGDITEYGDKIVFLTNPYLPPPKFQEIAHWVGKPFDRTYQWANPHATYCSRLIADLLGVGPRPMSFDTDVWQHAFGRPGLDTKGLGIDPDELFEELLLRGFRQDPCVLALEPGHA